MALDPDDPRPPYQQIAADITAKIRDGVYQPGAALPSRHQMTEDYGVAAATVQSAVRTLVNAGVVVGRQGQGVFVRIRPSSLLQLANDIEQDAGYLSMTPKEIVVAVADRIRRFSNDR